MREIPLRGGWVTAGVVRVGETVRRPPGPNTDLVRLDAISAVQELMSRVVAGTPAVNKHEAVRQWLAENGPALVG